MSLTQRSGLRFDATIRFGRRFWRLQRSQHWYVESYLRNRRELILFACNRGHRDSSSIVVRMRDFRAGRDCVSIACSVMNCRDFSGRSEGTTGDDDGKNEYNNPLKAASKACFHPPFRLPRVNSKIYPAFIFVDEWKRLLE